MRALFRLTTYLLALFLALLAIWAAGYVWFIVSAATMQPQYPEQTTDAVLVLTGGQNRVNAGLDLLAGGKAPRLFISGVNPKVTEEDLMTLWRPDRDEDPCCVELGYQAEDTHGNAVEARSWIEREEIKSVRLVTSNYHMLRSVMLLRHELPLVEVLRHPVRSPSAEPGTTPFWAVTFKEYNKLLLTWLHLNVLNRAQ